MAVTDHPDVQRLIAKTVEFQADIKQLEIYLDNERAKNKQLTTKLTEIEAYGCYVEDESGHTCGMAVENKRLRIALGNIIRFRKTSASVINPKWAQISNDMAFLAQEALKPKE